MENEQKNGQQSEQRSEYIPGQWSAEAKERRRVEMAARPRRGCPIGWVITLVCLVTVLSILFTHTLTVADQRKYYTPILRQQQELIERLEEAVDGSASKLELFAAIFQTYGYYAGDKTEEELMDAVLKAYATATGDRYAEYYTDEEYRAMAAENNGDYEGIGVSVIQTTVEISGVEYQVFQVIAIYENAPAQSSDLQIGDLVYAVKDGDEYKSIAAVGGYTKALTMIRGESGTSAEFAAFRPDGKGSYQSIEFSIVRGPYESQSVRYYTKENDPTVGVIHISSFDMTTPIQLKEAVKALKSGGAEHFVFDLRNNPGGDLESIKAVLSYFLQPGDLILRSIDRDGNAVKSYYAEATELTGGYAPCSVAQEEVGMFADLDMTVLCNGNTASAAEVFVATLRDFGLSKVIGETTFGKGIMQTTVPLSTFDSNYSGYIKMTTYAYVTQCGVTYHEIGIEPSEGLAVALSEQAMQYNFYVLPQELDDQLQAAFAQFQ